MDWTTIVISALGGGGTLKLLDWLFFAKGKQLKQAWDLIKQVQEQVREAIEDGHRWQVERDKLSQEVSRLTREYDELRHASGQLSKVNTQLNNDLELLVADNEHWKKRIYELEETIVFDCKCKDTERIKEIRQRHGAKPDNERTLPKDS